ncbi:MAG: IclR family transcriptional regulator [SAR324 cluster bacterium]|nr:IclR family transcriptional regulator [SAR324 cluster bacterium]
MVIKRSKKEYSIQAVDNSFDVLEQFTNQKGDLGITELSRALGLHKNNIFRLLATLETRGYIEQDLNTGNYKLGTKILELNLAYHKHTSLLKIARSVLDNLVAEVKENSYLGLVKNNQVVYVEHAESSQVLRVSSRIGIRLSPLCTAIGKVVLAFSGEEERKSVIRANKFVKHTEHTIINENDLAKAIELIQKKGYAIDNEELDKGVTCVAGPIFNYERNVVAGISISGPSSRLDEKILKDTIIPAVLHASKKISRAIGYID